MKDCMTVKEFYEYCCSKGYENGIMNIFTERADYPITEDTEDGIDYNQKYIGEIDNTAITIDNSGYAISKENIDFYTDLHNGDNGVEEDPFVLIEI